MATRKITRKNITDLVKSGAAIDFTYSQNKPKRSDLKLIGVSLGSVGMNAALFLNEKTGRMYAITSSCSLLFEYV